jgi:hypothetical protein
MKKFAQTVEFELERKKVEKLKNHEFNNQGRSSSHKPLPFTSSEETPSYYSIFFFTLCNLCVHVERNIVINKHNQILLNRLVDISHGKWLSVQPKNRASETFGPRSLNVVARKRENERIERENQAFAKRLFAR